jgi:hypothetical protein
MFGRATVDKTGVNGAGPAWIPDSASTKCTSCRKDFTMLLRRHHCRNCGKIFCMYCSKNFRLLPANFQVREPQRVCNDCCDTLEPLQDELAATIANSTRMLKPNDKSNVLDSNPISFSLSAEVLKAVKTIDNFFVSNYSALL